MSLTDDENKYLYDRVEKLQLKYNMRAIISLIANKVSPAPLKIDNFLPIEMYDWVMINHNGIENANEVGQVFYISKTEMYMYIFDLGVMPLIKKEIGICNPISSICKHSYLESIKKLNKEIRDYKIKKDMIETTNMVLNKKLKKEIYWV